MESVLRQRGSKLGSARVLAELREKGLNDDLLQTAAEQLKSTEAERARAVWEKKFGQPPKDARERARQMRFMASRGFAAELVYRLIDGKG